MAGTGFDKRGKSVRFSDGEGRDRVIKPMTGDMITAAYPASRAQVRPELAVMCAKDTGDRWPANGHPQARTVSAAIVAIAGV